MATQYLQLPVKPKLVKTLFTQTASKTVADTDVETTLLSSGVGSLTLPANFLKVGTVLRVYLCGFHSSTSNPTATIKVKFGSTEISSGSDSSGNGTAKAFHIRCSITCRSVGASGSVVACGEYVELHNNGSSISLLGTAAVTVDTTTEQTLDLTFKWSAAAAGNTITCVNAVVEALNW